MRALLVIDMQNVFLKAKNKSLPKKIYTHIKKQNYDHVLFTKFVNKADTNFVKLLDWKKAFKPPYTDIAEPLTQLSNKNNTFEKDTYSAFKSEKLKKFVKAKKITELELCGVELDSCVLATAFEAFDLGYNVKVLKTLSVSTGRHLNMPTLSIVDRNIDRRVHKRNV